MNFRRKKEARYTTMEAGLSYHVWSTEEIIDLIPKPVPNFCSHRPYVTITVLQPEEMIKQCNNRTRNPQKSNETQNT